MTVYANSITWLQNRWIDYLAPQIYWQRAIRQLILQQLYILEQLHQWCTDNSGFGSV